MNVCLFDSELRIIATGFDKFSRSDIGFGCIGDTGSYNGPTVVPSTGQCMSRHKVLTGRRESLRLYSYAP